MYFHQEGVFAEKSIKQETFGVEESALIVLDCKEEVEEEIKEENTEQGKVEKGQILKLFKMKVR